MAPTGAKVFCFEGFTLDLGRGCLRAGDREIELRPKSFELLRYLVENAGRLVPKDELINAIWPSVVVTDESLTRCVSDVRLALRDREQHVIRTVSRRGYLLDATVSEAVPPVIAPSHDRGSHGARLDARPAERRQLTIMACELAGLAALSAQLDPEDLRAVTAKCHRFVTEIIARHHGYVARYQSEGVLAYFGYPDAREHDAENAVRAGLALIGSAAPLAAACRTRIELRIGVASGLVVIGEELGAAEARGQTAVGETPNLARRLQGAAQAGTLVVAEVTRRLVGGLFEYRDLGRVTLPGFAEPVRMWRVLGPSAIDSRFEAQRGLSLTPLVGREEELALLLRRWEQAKAGDGSVVLISGEPGIGKSRIVEALEERLSAESHTRLRSFCSPHHQDSTLYPSIVQLERAAGLRRHDTAEQRLTKLEAVLSQATCDLAEAVPVLAELLSIPTGGRYPPLSLTPQKRKEKTLRALLAQVEGLAARQPVLMVLADLHWSDPTTRDLLDLLIDRFPALRVLLVLTFRPEFTPTWIGRPHVTLLSLSRLAPRQCAELIAGVTGGKALPNEIADQIIERADGVPLFIEELTKAVVESGVLVDAGDRYEVTGPVAPLAIPTTLHASLLARLDRLAAAREVAQTGAALGRQFSHELIAAVATLPPPQLEDGLARLVRAGLIFQRGSPPDAHYSFKHALVRDEAYACLLRDQRRQIHARVAATLQSQFPEVVAVQPQLMAQHCAEAGLDEKAVGYWLIAGRQALARSNMTEAASQLGRGLELVSGLPDSAQRRRQELELQIGRCQVLIATQGYAAPAVGQALARARQICDQQGAPPQLAHVLWGQVLHEVVRGEVEPARRHAEEMQQLGEARKDVPLLATGVRLAGNVCFWRGDFAAARDRLERTLALFDAAHRPLYGALTGLDDHHVSALIYLFRTLAALGYPDQARARRDNALAEARRLSHPYPLANALFHAAHGDWGVEPNRVLLERAEEVSALSSEHGFLLWLAGGRVMHGWCLVASGRFDEGIALVNEEIAIRRRLDSPLQVPFALTLLADAYRRAMRPEEGLTRTRRGLGHDRSDAGAMARGGDASRSRRVARLPRPVGRRREELRRGARGGAAPERETVGAARGDRPRSPLARSGQTQHSSRPPRASLRLVHGRPRRARPQGGEGDFGWAELKTRASDAPPVRREMARRVGRTGSISTQPEGAVAAPWDG